jgi:hypothetical protein
MSIDAIGASYRDVDRELRHRFVRNPLRFRQSDARRLQMVRDICRCSDDVKQTLLLILLLAVLLRDIPK